jgi:hypothetical protein
VRGEKSPSILSARKELYGDTDFKYMCRQEGGGDDVDGGESDVASRRLRMEYRAQQLKISKVDCADGNWDVKDRERC